MRRIQSLIVPPYVLTPVLALLAAHAYGHGGFPPAGVAGFPSGLIDPPSPNRSPFCEVADANGPCGTTASCLAGEPAQPLAPGQNRYAPGQTFEVPWLIAVVHGNGNAFEVTLLDPVTGRQDLLLTNFPQGEERRQGEVISLSPILVPRNFPPGPAVLEAYVDVGGDRYYDCADLVIDSPSDFVFSDGFEF